MNADKFTQIIEDSNLFKLENHQAWAANNTKLIAFWLIDTKYYLYIWTDMYLHLNTYAEIKGYQSVVQEIEWRNSSGNKIQTDSILSDPYINKQTKDFILFNLDLFLLDK